MKRSVKGLLLLFVVAFCCLALIESNAQDMPVPPLIQSRYFKKVFAYNKSLPKDGIKIVVVYTDASANMKDDMVEAFSAVGMNASAVKVGQLAAGGVGANVIYVLPGVDIKPVKEFCRTNSIMSATGFPKWVKDGDISVGIDAVNDVPKVIINTDRLKTEKQDAADLMRLR